MKLKKNGFFIASGVTFALAVGTLLYLGTKRASEPVYDLQAVQQTRTVTSLQADSLTLSNGYPISLDTSGLNGWTLSSGGYIASKTAIRGIDSITVTFASGGNLQLMPGWEGYSVLNPEMRYDGDVANVTTATSCSVSFDANSRPDFFKIYAKAETTIQSISFTYECASDTVVSSYRFSIGELSINGGEALDAGNYVWLESNFTGETTQVCLAYDAQIGYYHDFENLPVGGNIWTNVYLVRSATQFGAGFKASDGSFSDINVGPGATGFRLTQATFNGQPSDASYTFTLTVTPTWDDGTDTLSTTNLWVAGDPVLFGESGQEWLNAQMTKNGGTYTYTFTNVPAGTYDYAVLAAMDSYQWNPSKESNHSFTVSSNNPVNLTDSWVEQPVPAASTYDIDLTVTATGTPSNFGNMQFVYNYDNSTSTYVWPAQSDYIATKTWSSPFAKTIEDLDRSKTIYFKIYMWSDATSIYVGDVNGKNFVLEPQNVDTEEVTISFAYSASASIVGSCDIVEVEKPTSMSFANQTTTVYAPSGPIEITPTFDKGSESFTASYSGEDIRIDDNKYIVGLKAGTTTTVNLTSASGLKCSFTVKVNSSGERTWYDKTWNAQSIAFDTAEGWFNSTTIDEITGMGQDFMHGVDISNTWALYHYGTKFYNTSGVEESLFHVFRDAGVNWVRLRLWVDPQSHNSVAEDISYGAGECNLEHVLWMAKEAKAAGLNFLLDFHYSDYWTHPGQQIIPKSWNDCASKSDLCARIKSYTTETLNSFKDAGCLPDMVQLGNEISSGIFLQKYKGGDESFNGDFKPSYLTNTADYTGNNGYGTKTAAEFYDYIKAASEGVDAVNSSIKKVIHWAKGSSISAGTINNFFNAMPGAYYDYAAISFYPFFCFDHMSEAQTILSGLSLSKPWFIAETSYPFSGGSWAGSLTGHAISNDTKRISTYGKDGVMTDIIDEYAFTMAGQANMFHDINAAVVASGGKGVFYWEAAWVPNAHVGWAGEGSRTTYSNQGFFSYDGYPLANLNVFKQMSPYIN